MKAEELSLFIQMEQTRWGGNPVCPHCNSTNPYRVSDRSKKRNTPSYRCSDRSCGLPFNVTTGTPIQGHKVPISKWLLAARELIVTANGISTIQLGKKIGVTQKTAFYMKNKLRSPARRIGESLAWDRWLLNISQKQVIEAIGISEPRLSAIERNLRIDPVWEKKISDYYNTLFAENARIEEENEKKRKIEWEKNRITRIELCEVNRAKDSMKRAGFTKEQITENPMMVECYKLILMSKKLN